MHRSVFSLISLRMSVVTFVLFFCMFPGMVQADESHVYTAVSSFTWKEFDESGARLVKESGELYGIGYAFRSISSDQITVQPEVELFGGAVDYDGTAQIFNAQTNSITIVPAKSTVDYFGIKLKIEAGSLMPVSKDSSLEPFFGLGIAAWTRKIKDATLADGTTATGNIEKWRTMHLRLGLRGHLEASSRTRIFAEAGAKLPFYTENTSHVTLHPGNEISYFGEAGAQLRAFKASIFYDGMRFSRSSGVTSGAFIYYQPRSTSDLIGLKLGAAF